MSAGAKVAAAPSAPLWGELRYSGELIRLLADRELRGPSRRPDAQPVLLIPGFMAGDGSLAVLSFWLRRRGHRVAMSAPLPEHVTALAVHSRSDAIVDWRACLDPHAESVEVDSSHCGMSVHPGVYRALARLLDESQEPAWSR